MKKGLFAGTFDPPSLGHLNVIQRALRFCDHLIVGVAYNSEKKPWRPLEERCEMLREITKGTPQLEIVAFEGLTVEFARQRGVSFLVRGIRNELDAIGEMQMATANRALSGIDTLLLMAEAPYGFVSSSLIREIARCKGDISKFVPPEVAARIGLRTPPA
jgi:pantetheine-phosphate adenylyltransferase